MTQILVKRSVLMATAKKMITDFKREQNMDIPLPMALQMAANYIMQKEKEKRETLRAALGKVGEE
jgi:hypothetical protein